MSQSYKAEESSATSEQKRGSKNFADYFSLVITTFGVGYLPIAPGTWGSLVGVGIYLLVSRIETNIFQNFYAESINQIQLSAWIHFVNAIVFLIFCLLGIWASSRATILFKDKDPSQAVVDEVIGQIVTFMFVPLVISGWLVFAGFLLFRLFDIWKPYPINLLEKLPAGLGICADDLLAGVYAGIGLLLIYALSITFF